MPRKERIDPRFVEFRKPRIYRGLDVRNECWYCTNPAIYFRRFMYEWDGQVCVNSFGRCQEHRKREPNPGEIVGWPIDAILEKSTFAGMGGIITP